MHVDHNGMTPTRSPVAKTVTPGPRAATVPTTSWPGTIGVKAGFAGSQSPSTMCRLERQTPQAATLTSSWPGPGSGVSISVMCSGWPSIGPGFTSRTALMVVLLQGWTGPVSYTHLRAHETRHDLVCRLL